MFRSLIVESLIEKERQLKLNAISHKKPRKALLKISPMWTDMDILEPNQEPSLRILLRGWMVESPTVIESVFRFLTVDEGEPAIKNSVFASLINKRL